MQFNISIPDKKAPFFLELMKSLGFVKMTKLTIHETGLTSVQKELVDIELKKAKKDPSYMLDFDSAWKSVNTDI